MQKVPNAGQTSTSIDGWRRVPLQRPMSKKKLRVHQADVHHLIANLRGEIGELIVTWTLWRGLRVQASSLRTPDVKADLSNRHLVALDLLSDKLHDDLIARLSELAEAKVGQLTFHFAVSKLKAFEADAREFARKVRRLGLEEKRNKDISHKVLPESWSDHKYRHVPYRSVLHCLALAVRLMKRIDRYVLGPAAPYLWREARKKRYDPMTPPRVGYLILPYMRLSKLDRERIISEEVAEGKKQVWTEMQTLLNGRPTRILAAKEWGGLLLGRRLLMLEDYPVGDIRSINTSAVGDSDHETPDT